METSHIQVVHTVSQIKAGVASFSFVLSINELIQNYFSQVFAFVKHNNSHSVWAQQPIITLDPEYPINLQHSTALMLVSNIHSLKSLILYLLYAIYIYHNSIGTIGAYQTQYRFCFLPSA